MEQIQPRICLNCAILVDASDRSSEIQACDERGQNRNKMVQDLSEVHI